MGRLQMKVGEKKPRVSRNYSDPGLRRGQVFHALHDGCTGKRWKIEASCLLRLEIIHLTLPLQLSFIWKGSLDENSNVNNVYETLSSPDHNTLATITGWPRGRGRTPTLVIFESDRGEYIAPNIFCIIHCQRMSGQNLDALQGYKTKTKSKYQLFFWWFLLWFCLTTGIVMGSLN